jgi:thiamine transport system ATP-binding protein
MLTIDQLSLVPFLKEISFTLKPGETLAVMGRSGSGKTTLLKAIAGFTDHFSTGEILYDGTIWQDRRRKYLNAFQRPASLLFQENAIWPHLTVRQQLDLVGSKNDTTAKQLGLCPKTLGRELSGGEKQRLALGRVLKAKNPVLLLDEPFASLDPQNKAQMIKLLADHQAVYKSAVLIATHDPDDVKALGANALKLL